VVTRTPRFDLEVDASSTATAMRLAELALAEEPITPQVADALLADLKLPVTVRGLREIVSLGHRAEGTDREVQKSARLLAEGRFREAADPRSVRPGAGLAVLVCDARYALYALGQPTPPERMPAMAEEGPAILCWREGSDRSYLVLRYNSPAERREAAATLIAILDLLPNRQMLVGDLHQHSNRSDGTGDPEEMFFETVSHFTDFHTLTDHNTVAGAQAIAQELPSWGMDYPFFVGEEVTLDDAHMVAVDPNGLVDWKGDPMAVLKRIHDSGAVAILAHPDFPTSAFQDVFHRNPFARPEMNAFQHNPQWYADWKRKGTIPPMVEVTDTHDMSLAMPTRAIVFAHEATTASIKQALFDGNCCAWTPDGPKGPDRITRVVWALISDREYYEDQQLRRMAARVLQLK
jgi:hypothetical protein